MSRNQTVIPLAPTQSSYRTLEEPIPLSSRITHKFFEPIVLLKVLTDAVKSTAKPPPLEARIDLLDPKQVFCAFVNKLGHVCDSTKGGETVTSFTVLRQDSNPDYAHYVFAANVQTDSQLEATSTYVKTLLHQVGKAPEYQEDQREVRRSLLYHILRFNRPRITLYLQDLHPHIVSCLANCRTDNTYESKHAKSKHERLKATNSRVLWQIIRFWKYW